jgi:putative intracellular protease/amidase
MIVTSNARMGATDQATGLYLPELAHPYEVLESAGYAIDVASPEGGEAPIDPKSLSPELSRFVPLTKNTLPLEQVDPANYDAFMVVGGHGTMWDLPNDQHLQRLLPEAYASGKVIAAVCHGPAALTRLKKKDGSPLLEGRHVTGFTNDEEAAVGLTTVMPFLLEDALKSAGGKYIKAPNWQANVVVDQNIVTGQNPASARGVGEAIARLIS